MAVYKGIFDGPGRNYSKTSGGAPRLTRKRYIVIHNTSNDASDQNEASYAKRRTDGVSSHYYVDADSIVQSLDTDWRAWHVGSDKGNSEGISYEITGANAKTRSWWLSRVAWDLLAKQIRLDCAEHGITPRLLTVDQIKAGVLTGIITHDQARRAWGSTTHTDPGPNFPLDHLLARVTEETDMPNLDLDDIAFAVWSYTNEKLTTSDAYQHLRNPETAKTILAELKASRLRDEAILAAVKGVDTTAVIAAVNAAATADAERDTALLAELRDLANGGADAEAILDALAVRLAHRTS